MRKSDTRLAAVGMLLAALICMPATVWANAVSQALYTKGLIPFNAEHWNEAYQLFDEAVTADPNDPLAAYYRGLCAGRLGFPDVAKQEIERALKLWPALPGAALDLGILYFDAQQYDVAETWLHRAYELPNDRFPAALFLGMSRYHRGDDANAAKYLSEAAKDPQLRPTAQYYSGLVALRQNRTAEATQLFGDVRAAQPNTDIGRIADEYLTTGATTPPPPVTTAAAAPEHPKPWGVYAGGAFEYDSNVVLAPTDGTTPPGAKDQSDGRFVLDAGGFYRVLDQQLARISLGYELTQSLHFSLSKYDLQTHRLRADFSGNTGLIGYGLSGWYEFDLLDFKAFEHQGVGLPWVALYEGKVGASQFYYRVRGEDYLDDPFDPFLDGVNHAVGLRQSFLLGAVDRYITAGYQFDDEDAASVKVNGVSVPDQFDYLGHQFDALLSSGIGGWVNASLGYLFHYMDYSEPNTRNASGFHRRDRQHQILAEVKRDIIPGLSARFWYIGTFNDSNTDEFRYDRHVVHLGVMYAF